MTRTRDPDGDEGAGTLPLTSLSLLERVKTWEPGAWQRLVDVSAPLVYRWCRRAGIKAGNAPDVLQEVFVAVATHIEDFHRDRPGDSFRGWLFTVTRNKIRDHTRCRKNQPTARGGSSANERLCRFPNRLASMPDADQQLSDETLVAQRVVEFARAEVQDRTWRAFWRLAVDGQSGPDVAAELGMSLQAIHQAKYRVLRLIRREMDCLPL